MDWELGHQPLQLWQAAISQLAPSSHLQSLAPVPSPAPRSAHSLPFSIETRIPVAKEPNKGNIN
eukprot:5316287-Amphidinium_carterae.1